MLFLVPTKINFGMFFLAGFFGGVFWRGFLAGFFDGILCNVFDELLTNLGGEPHAKDIFEIFLRH